MSDDAFEEESDGQGHVIERRVVAADVGTTQTVEVRDGAGKVLDTYTRPAPPPPPPDVLDQAAFDLLDAYAATTAPTAAKTAAAVRTLAKAVAALAEQTGPPTG